MILRNRYKKETYVKSLYFLKYVQNISKIYELH